MEGGALEHCGHCSRQLSTTARRVCARCRRAAYCSKACQLQSWKSEHKRQCAVASSDATVAQPRAKSVATTGDDLQMTACIHLGAYHYERGAHREAIGPFETARQIAQEVCYAAEHSGERSHV